MGIHPQGGIRPGMSCYRGYVFHVSPVSQHFRDCGMPQIVHAQPARDAGPPFGRVPGCFQPPDRFVAPVNNIPIRRAFVDLIPLPEPLCKLKMQGHLPHPGAALGGTGSDFSAQVAVDDLEEGRRDFGWFARPQAGVEQFGLFLTVAPRPKLCHFWCPLMYWSTNQRPSLWTDILMPEIGDIETSQQGIDYGKGNFGATAMVLDGVLRPFFDPGDSGFSRMLSDPLPRSGFSMTMP